MNAFDSVAARCNRSLALIKAKRYAEAESDANAVLAKEDGNVKARLRRGWARFELGRYDDASVDLRRCLELQVSLTSDGLDLRLCFNVSCVRPFLFLSTAKSERCTKATGPVRSKSQSTEPR